MQSDEDICLQRLRDVNPGRTSVDFGVNVNLELVDKFCYSGDMLSVDGDTDADVETRI